MKTNDFIFIALFFTITPFFAIAPLSVKKTPPHIKYQNNTLKKDTF